MRWANDADYLAKLSPAELEWYEQFADEYYNGTIKKGDEKAIHKTDAQRKDCYQRKNFANNDVYGLFEAWRKMAPLTDEPSDES